MKRTPILALALIAGCSIFQPVAQQVAVVPILCRGCVWVADINDGLPLVSTPHRMMVWRDESGELHFAPETSEANVFTALDNLPATVGSMVPVAGGTAIGK